MDKFTEKLGGIIKKTPQIARENTEIALQKLQSQARKLVSASDDLGKTISKFKDGKNFQK